MALHSDTTQDWHDRHRSALAQEKTIQFDRFTYPDAWALGSRLVETATRHGYPVAIGINFGQQRVFHAALEGSAATNDDWLARKIRAVYKHNYSSWALECLVRATAEDYHRVYGYRTEDIAVAGGAVPIRVRGSLIGAVGVSGLESEEDHRLVIAELAALCS